MCTEIYDPVAKVRADSPRQLADLIGAENIVWHAAYEGLPSTDDPHWMDGCLCPVNIDKTMEKIGGQSHGYMGESGYFEITLPPPPSHMEGAEK